MFFQNYDHIRIKTTSELRPLWSWWWVVLLPGFYCTCEATRWKQHNEKCLHHKPFFNCSWRLSTSMFLYNISPIRVLITTHRLLEVCRRKFKKSVTSWWIPFGGAFPNSWISLDSLSIIFIIAAHYFAARFRTISPYRPINKSCQHWSKLSHRFAVTLEACL